MVGIFLFIWDGSVFIPSSASCPIFFGGGSGGGIFVVLLDWFSFWILYLGWLDGRMVGYPPNLIKRSGARGTFQGKGMMDDTPWYVYIGESEIAGHVSMASKNLCYRQGSGGRERERHGSMCI